MWRNRVLPPRTACSKKAMHLQWVLRLRGRTTFLFTQLLSSADLYQKLLTYRKVKLKRCRAHKMYDGQVQVQCCFTSTETVRTIRDPESRTATSTFTQLFSSDPPQSSSILVRSFLAVGSYLMPQCRARPGHRDSSLYFCLGPPVRSPCLPVSSQTSSTAAAWPVRTDTEDFRKCLCKLQALVYDSSVSANSKHWFTTFFSLCKLQALVYDILSPRWRKVQETDAGSVGSLLTCQFFARHLGPSKCLASQS